MCENCDHKDVCKYQDEFQNLVEACSIPRPTWARVEVRCKLFRAIEKTPKEFDTGRGGTDEN